MGFSISWLGFIGIEKSEVLSRLGMEDTGIEDPGIDAPFSIAVTENGSIIVFSNDFDFASGDRLATLSSACTLLACQVEEHVMFSSACCWVHQIEQWRVEHESERGIYDLRVSGNLPSEHVPVLERARAEQSANGGEGADVDYIFDGPLELAEAICGFKHDKVGPNFTELKSTTSSRWWPMRKKS